MNIGLAAEWKRTCQTLTTQFLDHSISIGIAWKTA